VLGGAKSSILPNGNFREFFLWRKEFCVFKTGIPGGPGWNVVDKLPMWGITSTDGDGELVQATLEAVDGSRLGRFFVQIVPLGD